MSSLSDLLDTLVFLILVVANIGAIFALLWLANFFAPTNWILTLILIFIALGIFGALIEEGKQKA